MNPKRWSAAFGTHRRLLPYVTEHRGAIGSASFLTLLLVISDLARPWPVKIVIDQVILGEDWSLLPDFLRGPEHRMTLLWASCAAVLLLAVFGGALAYGRNVLLARAGHGAVERLRKDVYRHLLALSLRFHDRHRRGDLLVRLTGDATMMKMLLVEGVFFLAQEILVVIGVITVMCFVDLQLTGVAVLTVPSVAFLVLHYGKKLKAAARKQRKKEGEIATSVSEALASVPMIQAYGLEEASVELLRKRGKRSRKSGLAAAKLEAAMSRATEIAIAVGTAVLLLLGSQRVVAGQMSAGELIVLLSYVRTLYKPLRRVAVRAAKVFKSAAGGERILEVLDAPRDLESAPGATIPTEVTGTLRLSEVSYAYRQGETVLENICLEIHPGEHVALLGANGAGKSTLASLLPRLRDVTSGSVTFDGLDVRDFDLSWLRQQIAVVFQHPLLLDGSIEDNLRLGAPDVEESIFERALEDAGVSDLLAHLPEGIRTRVGEGGTALSGGQRQRVALARALLRDPEVLVLDEPTSAIDDVSARRLRHDLPRQRKGRTLLCITHDEAWIEAMDRAIVLDSGRIVFDGPAAQWLANPGRNTGVEHGTEVSTS